MTEQNHNERHSQAQNSPAKTIGYLRELDTLTDRDLIRQFSDDADQDTFRVLIKRHGGLVYHVCWRMLRHHQDAEDAFQATFLVLARSARRVHWKKSLGNWLYGVAHRLSLKPAARRCKIREEVPSEDEAEGEVATADPFEMIARQEAEHVLHQELVLLPAKYRVPLLVCYLQGKSREEAAAELGCTPGTLKGRLERGRIRLRLRLSLRGVSLPAIIAGVPPSSLILPPWKPARSVAPRDHCGRLRPNGGSDGRRSGPARRVHRPIRRCLVIWHARQRLCSVRGICTRKRRKRHGFIYFYLCCSGHVGSW